MTDATEAPTERYLVTMRSAFLLPDGTTSIHEATDHVATAELEAYVKDARTRWQAVIVAETPDQVEGAYDAAAITSTTTEG